MSVAKSVIFCKKGWLLILFLAAILTLLVFIIMQNTPKTHPVISQSDHRVYKYLQLENKLRVLLVSDPKVDHAAAALNVGVGSGSDPVSRMGMAHFLEHMLFLGTAKYPQTDAYSSFISAHGGHYNAYTSFEHTNYFFDIDKSYLQEALDIFAQFFIEPLFSPDYLEREQHAVHSEYQGYLGNDDVNHMYVMKEIMNPKNTFSKFNIGSLETLKTSKENDLGDDVKNFYANYYSANIMTLVVIGAQDLSLLEKWVKEIFTGIKNKNVQIPTKIETFFNLNYLPAQINIKPKKDERLLDLYFPVPVMQQFYTSKPYTYINNLLGDEGQGSILAWLKSKGWANELSSGSAFNYKTNNLFNISLELTPTGLTHKDEIVSAIFNYISLIETNGVEFWRSEELQQLSKINFSFQEKQESMQYALKLAHDMHYYPIVDLLTGSTLISEFNPKLIKQALSHLKPDNMLLVLSHPNAKTNKVEKWFAIPYALEDINAANLTTWNTARINLHNNLSLPLKNLFIPSNVQLNKIVTQVPEIVNRYQKNHENIKLIYQQKNIQGWYKQDVSFSQPRGELYIKIALGNKRINSRDSAIMQLYVRMLHDKLATELYQVKLANLDYNIYVHPQGISIKLSGFYDKQSLLLESLLSSLGSSQLDNLSFQRVKNNFIHYLDNKITQSPYRHMFSSLAKLLIVNLFSDTEIKHQLETITLEDINKYLVDLYSNSSILTFSHGNYTPSQAIKFNYMISSTIGNNKAYQDSGFAVINLYPSRIYMHAIDNQHPDASLLVYFQGQDTGYKTQALFELLAQIIHVPFFEDLRTKQQLGYKVSAFSYPMYHVPGIGFAIESNVASVQEIYNKISAFLIEYITVLTNMSAEELNKNKQAVLTNLLAKDNSMSQKSDRYWQQLNQSNYSFDAREQLGAEIKKINKLEILSWYTQLLNTPQSKKMLVYSFGKDDQNINFERTQTHVKVLKKIRSGQHQGYFTLP